MEAAPFFADVADGPPDAAALWTHAADGVRLRIVGWRTRGTARGSVLLLAGRTEYAEKYGPTARFLTERGLDVLTLDWRGQGLSDRIFDADPVRGHVARFSDYQLDVAAAMATAEALGFAAPWMLLAHSMGGCIGLRALIDGLPVTGAAFSAPMWGISINAIQRTLAWAIGAASRKTGQSHRYTPGTPSHPYTLEAEFAGNLLTTDAQMFDWMRDQVRHHGELALGGPSLQWLHEALIEMKALASLPSPGVPTLAAVGSAERIVDPRAIRRRMSRWPEGTLTVIPQARHEILMERRDIREGFLAAALERAGFGEG